MSRSKPEDRVCISGIGMISSLGHDVKNACAAARAGITRPSELKGLNFQASSLYGKETPDGFPLLVGHQVPGINSGFVGRARAVILGSAAMKSLLLNSHFPPEKISKTAIHLNLSDKYILDVFADEVPEKFEDYGGAPSENWAKETQNLIPEILLRAQLPSSPSDQTLYFGGHAGILQAVRDGIEKIDQGIVDQCLVGAIDSCIEPEFLEAAAYLGILKTNVNPNGISPGEGAGFLILERAGEIRKAGGKILGVFGGMANKQNSYDQFSEDPPLGQGLGHCIQEVLKNDSPNDEFPSVIMGDLNGIERRAVEWGYAVVRLNSKMKIGDIPFLSPSMSFGEAGAATGIFAIGLTLNRFERGYATGGKALLWLTSDDGMNAAFTLKH